MMHQDYWFLNKEEYEPWLERFAITEPEYLSALQAITKLFPRESALEYFRATAARLGSLNHFDLLPYPNQRLQYNPIPILLNVDGAGILSQLLYLGLALRDTKNAMGLTKAFSDLTSEINYRGALFEIEVGAELVRSGLKPAYRTTSPDYIIEELPLGVEATMRDVPLSRAVAERLTATLAFLEFKHLSIELTAKGEHNSEELIDEITKGVERLLNAGETELIQPHYHIRHDQTEAEERTVAIAFGGEYRYEETLSHLITSRLREKEEKIRKGLAGGPEMKCIAALDIRSLLALPIEPASVYERQMAERHRPYFDRLRVFRQEVVRACQTFAAQSPLIKGILLWGRKRIKTPADEVHRRYSICLVTAEQNIEVDKHNLSDELVAIAQGKTDVHSLDSGSPGAGELASQGTTHKE
jgi:hypothetical protein